MTMRRTQMLLTVIGLLVMVAGIAAQNTGTESFVEAAVDQTSVYIGQPITFTFSFYAVSDSSSGKRYVPPDFDGFGQREGEVVQSSELINGTPYRIFRQSTQLTPNRSGLLTIAPAQLIIPETPFAAEQRLQTSPIDITVNPLPEPVPSDFIGAVGRFDISEVSLAPETVTVRQPLTLRLILSGTGSLEQVQRPELTLDEAQWRTYNNALSVDDSGDGTRSVTFEWLLIPQAAGPQTLPAIPMSIFDPDSASFITLLAELPAVQVAPGDETIIGSVPANADARTDEASSEPLSTVALRPIGSRPAPATNGLLFWLLWLIAPLISAAAWLKAHQPALKRPQRTRKPVQSSAALNSSRQYLARAVAADPSEAHSMIGRAIIAYFSSKAGQQMNRDQLKAALDKLPDELQAQIRDCLRQAEAARYAPVDQQDAQTLARQTLRILVQVDALWKH